MISFSFLFCVPRHLPINRIDKSYYVLIKHRHSSICWPTVPHWVYHDRKTNRYIKIWQYDSKRSQMMLEAEKMGIFDEVTALETLLLDENHNCVGYITRRCRPLDPYTLELGQAMNEDPDLHDYYAFKQMTEIMKNKIRQTGFFYGDIRVANVGMSGNNCVIFDLDEIVTLEHLLGIKSCHLILSPYLFTQNELQLLKSSFE